MFAVTGAAGHLGINLIQELVQRGYKARAIIHHNSRGLENLPIETVSADVLDLGSLRAAFDGVERVYHLAGRISIVNRDRKQVEAVNITGVKNVIAACRICGVKRLVHISSIHAFNQLPVDDELNENRPLIPFDRRHTPYDGSKAEGERVVLTAINNGLDAVIINPSGIVGPYDYQPSHFGMSLLAIAKGKMPVNIDAGFNWVDVRDVALGIVAAGDRSKSGGKYLLSGHWASMAQIAQIAGEFTGRKQSPILLPIWVAKATAPFAMAFYSITRQRPVFTPIAVKALQSNKNISHAKASRELGYQPRPFRDTINETLSWFRANGYLEGK